MGPSMDMEVQPSPRLAAGTAARTPPAGTAGSSAAAVDPAKGSREVSEEPHVKTQTQSSEDGGSAFLQPCSGATAT